MSEPIHARVMTYAGHAYSPWAGSGRRKYTEPRTKDGQVQFACGRGLDDAHVASGEKFPWAALKSLRSREASEVTCPVCLSAIVRAGFVHARRVAS